MNAAMLSLMSGPIMALIRYAVTAGGAVAATKWGVDGQTISAVGAAVIAVASAGIGALTSTKTAAIAKVADLPGYGVQLPNGSIAKSANDAYTAHGVTPPK